MLQAAYQAALTQQAAAAQQLLLQQQGSQYIPPPPNFGHGGYNEALAAQVAAQLSLTPGYFNNSNINAAAAAAAAAAVQNIMSGSHPPDCKCITCYITQWVPPRPELSMPSQFRQRKRTSHP